MTLIEPGPALESVSLNHAPRASAPLVVDEIDTLPHLRRLLVPWQRLMALCPQATPFQAPEWALPWTERFAASELWTLAARRGDRLVGLLPLRLVRTGNERRVSFLGQGISDYGGALVAPGQAGEGVLEALLGRLRDRADHWDVCDLDQLPASDPLHGARLPTGLVDESAEQDVCPFVTLPRSADELAASLPRRLGPLGQTLRKLTRMGNARFEQANAHDLDELLDAFFRLHAAEWNERGDTGVLADQTLASFHREVAAGMLRAGRLRLHGLRIDGQIRAVIYGFVHGRRYYAYLSGFDPRFSSLSPGSLMIWRAMTAAIEERVETFDFLRGAEPYKYRWGARDRHNRRRLLRATAHG